MNYTYRRGSQYGRETVEFDVIENGQYVTTCSVDVDLLISGGIKFFPCGNGDDVKLGPKARLAILELVYEERDKIRKSCPIKTLKNWQESGLPAFEDFFVPGDIVSNDIVDHFVNSMPPTLMRSTCTQAGEPYSIELDPQTGIARETYITFVRVDGSTCDAWSFAGYCFCGETVNRNNHLSRLANRIIEAKKEVSGES